ncbi:MAG: class I SAM-dependent methyltransferase [Burkholderiales bacterium]|jgi:O-methyltransferase involved in polyketide biosynthesis|uniref:class I SAM-dependent methyltransferase n=1 Tax=Limnobacter sp. TaxID=2003368 RepID=UPI0039BC5E2E|nr:class I SAM-dependent methyltransferase [Burkholderiales bacterium]
MAKKLASQWLSAARISPTALYTGQVWQATGRSIPELKSIPASALYLALAPSMFVSRSFGGPTLEDFLLARHDLIDHHLTELIESGKITQIIEIAAGMSPRGSRFVERYGDKITYIEADLPGMVTQKKRLLATRLRASPNHHVKEVDAFAEQGEHSLDGLAMQLDTSQGLAVVTEGLLNYFDKNSVLNLWARVSSVLERFQYGAYLSDLHLKAQNSDPLAQAFVAGLGVFVRGQVHLHFETAGHLQQAMYEIGMACQILKPSDFADQVPACSARGANFCRILFARPAGAVK